jgi:hypothetical protein
VPRVEIEAKKVEKFSVIIDVLKKYKVLDGLGATIYGELHKLRKYRNKVHLQEDIEIEGVSRDDGTAFTDAIRSWAVDLNIRALKFFSEKLPRPKELHAYVNPIVVPSE